ncbi:hypothetical protein CKA32_004616 [Geitlerinema sp. FC II]|nr:hypothetical protein CKA32_004616 [Geitlerinema sp. FC II]
MERGTGNRIFSGVLIFENSFGTAISLKPNTESVSDKLVFKKSSPHPPLAPL